MAENLYTGRQVAALWKVEYETVLALVRAGELESVRVGRRRLFRESALRDYLDRHAMKERASNDN